MSASAIAATAEASGFRQRILRASVWTLVGYGFSQVLRLGSNLVMTRLLMPDMFGIMAIAHMLMVGLALLSDLGLRQNIVQSRRGEDPVFLNTAWAVQILRGLFLWGLALLVAAAVYGAQSADFIDPSTVYGNPLLPGVIALVAASALITGFQSTKVATAHRRLQQRKVIFNELAGQVASVAFMIAWASVSPSIWALVGGALVASLVSTALSHLLLAGPVNRLAWEREAVGELLGFGRWILLASGIGVLAISADRLLLGALVDTRVLGVYAIGQLIVGAVEAGAGRLFLNVSLPVLSEAARQDGAPGGALGGPYYRLQAPFDLVLFFSAGFLFAAGPALINVLYDQRYAQAGDILAVLALSLVAVRYGLAHQFYLALGQPRLMTLINAVRLGALTVLMPLGYWLGDFMGAVWAVALHNFLTAPVIYHFNRQFGITDLRREIQALPAFPVGLGLGWALSFALAHPAWLQELPLHAH